jgi:hypothetical protein
MKTIKQIVNQPTTGNGELKAGVATTKAAEYINNNEVIVTLTDNVEVSFAGKDYQLTYDIVTAAALFDGLKGKKSETDALLTSRLELYSSDFLSTLQRDSKDAGKEKKATMPVKGRVLSAVEYRMNCIKLALDVSNAEVISDLLLDIAAVSAKTTKTEVIDLLDNIGNVFFNAEQQATYNVIVDKEIEEAKEFEALVALGFSKVSKADDKILASLSFLDASQAIPALSGIGYKLVSSDHDMTNMLINVVLTKGEPAKLV